MEINFNFSNLTCCSVELRWGRMCQGKEDSDCYEYLLEKKEGPLNLITNLFKFEKIYQGDNTCYEVINLKPNKDYTFKLSALKSGKTIKEKIITITTKNSPFAILSEKSVYIANGEKINFKQELTQTQKNIIKNCSKLIYDEKNDNVIEGEFDGIEIKIAYDKETNINYISLDIKSNAFTEFFENYIKGFEDNLIIPSNFIIPHLPTILIFNLLEKGPVILTGKRMGGVFASSLVFYIMYVGISLNTYYGNAFRTLEKNCIGVVTFGSPAFINNLTAAVKMKDFASYFHNIKYEFDYIPEIIDFINQKHDYQNILDIFKENEIDGRKIKKLNDYLISIKYTKDNIQNNISNLKKIPFGYYYMMKELDNSLISINENSFLEFYYFKKFNTNKSVSHLKIYEKLKSYIHFNKENLDFLESKSFQIEFVRIIRRNILSDDKKEKEKGIIKFKLNKFGDNIISPDIIKKITLFSSYNNREYIINNKDIYYDNDIDITAYIDGLSDNINDITITNNFGGEMKAKNIINVQGSGMNQKMLKDNIEKIFLFPFFKLIEIFYTSLNDREKYSKLKEDNFGNDFRDIKIKILKSFEKQIQSLNELLFLSRPDILGKNEKEFVNEYIDKTLDDKQIKYFNDKLKIYYKQALKLQKSLNINCLDSESNSIANKSSFPEKIKNIKEKKKLFMCGHSFNVDDNLISIIFDDSYIKQFFLDQLIIDVLENIEKDIIKGTKDKHDDDFKNYLNNNIGNFYKEYIIPNIYFILILILTSIEGGDYIKFNHSMNWKNFIQKSFKSLPSLAIHFKNVWIDSLKDFEKIYTNKEIEELNMKNLFYKIKTKNIVDSNISQNNFKFCRITDFIDIGATLNYFLGFSPFKKNKIYEFSKYSEEKIHGKEYYEKFLEVLNNCSNEFQEDIQISIFDNLKDENKNKEKNYETIIDTMNNLINDEESKKGFLALLRQSYLLGKLRSEIVSNYLF